MTVIKTEYLNREVEKRVEVKVVSIPADCAKALSLAGSVGVDAERLVGVGTKTMDILADGHQALTEGNGTEVNSQRDKLYKLEVSANAASQDLSLIHLPKLNSALSACKATGAYKEMKP
ncbi:hypothetical protein AB0F25_30325 [Streptomyces wedmorensis]|uniref:hypothetical protein n=1 Tax=Streptomyces wedmorensis TaxID=43759 RepID=UPI00341FC9A1